MTRIYHLEVVPETNAASEILIVDNRFKNL